MRLVTHTITDAETLSFSSYKYSVFKHGDRQAAMLFAQELADVIIKNRARVIINLQSQTRKNKIAVFGAPYNGLKTASSYLAEFVTKYLNMYFQARFKDIEFVECKISRQHSYTQDYSAMTGEDREVALTSETFEFIPSVQELHEECCYALFIDDILITGAHERRIQELIAREDFILPHDFCYYALLQKGCCEPQFEDYLNNFAYRRGDQLLAYSVKCRLLREDFLPNTRVIKRLLTLSEVHLASLVEELTHWQLQLLLDSAKLNGYHVHETYKKNYHTIVTKINYELRLTEK